jgi:hypothetical protein
VAQVPVFADLVTRNAAGELEGVLYDKLPLYMLPVLKGHDDRLTVIEQRLRVLEAK